MGVQGAESPANFPRGYRNCGDPYFEEGLGVEEETCTEEEPEGQEDFLHLLDLGPATDDHLEAVCLSNDLTDEDRYESWWGEQEKDP